MWIAQPWINGVMYNFGCGDQVTLRNDTLNAFSHFTFDYYEHKTVLTNFQGIYHYLLLR
jgi:Alpha-kinase family